MVHYNDVIMRTMGSQITSLTNVYATVCSRRRWKKHQSSASVAFMRGIHRWPVNSPHKGPVTCKVFPFDDVIMWVYAIFAWVRSVKFVSKHGIYPLGKHMRNCLQNDDHFIRASMYYWCVSDKHSLQWRHMRGNVSKLTGHPTVCSKACSDR